MEPKTPATIESTSRGETVSSRSMQPVQLWKASFASKGVPPVVVDDAVIVAGDSDSVACLDAADGAERWTLDLSARAHTIQDTGSGLFVADSDGALQLYSL